ncbi:hypothetical protein [Desertimonas flava]|uniref:hypothetical protein n=1 Tax=Desertimonas flava TaxID=2064846 RepID=UPI000E34E40E|nr:hypothetical protein [Desertimonas flava]
MTVGTLAPFTADRELIPAHPLRRLRHACAIGAGVGLIPYLAVLWNFGWNPLRGATADHLNGNFYDLQARALFHGRLAVPNDSLGIEGFVVDGRTYMYFGPFPALLRMPLLLVTSRFDGRLTALSMLVGFVVTAIALTALVEQVRHRLRPDAPVSRLEAAAFAILVASVLGGTAIVFLASQPWVYHEVYVWTTALTLATLATLVRAWEEPTTGRVVTAGALAMATMLTRLPAGWSMSLSLIATGVWLAVRRARRSGWVLAGAGVLAIAVGAAVNWAKFRHVYMFPIDKHVWSRYSPHRRLVLFQNDGRIDGPQFFWTDLVSYFRPDGVRFTPWFPFVGFPAEPPGPIWGVHLDESFRTGSITALSPLLLVLAIWGFVVAFRPRGHSGAVALRIPLLGALGVSGGVMAFGYIAPRYLAEFVPVLALGGVVAVNDLAERVTRWDVGRRRTALGAMAVLAAYGLVANTAPAAMNAQRAWRGDSLVEMVSWQERISRITGNPLDHNVIEVDELPADAPADRLAVVGDCDAVYLATGETSATWIPVQVRPLAFTVAIGPDGTESSSSTPLTEFVGYTSRQLHVQVGPDGRARLIAVGVSLHAVGDWLDVEAGDRLDVTIHADTAINRYVATAEVTSPATGGTSEGASTVEIPMTEWDRRLHSVMIVPKPTPVPATAPGLMVSAAATEPPSLCRRLVD